jgi:hypothetical protein
MNKNRYKLDSREEKLVGLNGIVITAIAIIIIIIIIIGGKNSSLSQTAMQLSLI